MEDKLIQLEKYRKKAFYLFVIIIFVSAVTVFLMFALLKSYNQVGFMFSLASGVGLGALLYRITGYSRYLREFKEYFKKIFVEKPFRIAFEQVNYRYDKGIEQERLDGTDLILLGNRYYSNDYVQGIYKNVRFERADIKIQHHVNTGKHSHTITYFNGRWLIFEFNKNFRFDLQIIGNGFGYSQKNKSIFTDQNDRRHKIEMEDIEFNECFQVLGQDDHEAFYILTPHFMAVLKSLYSSTDGALMLGFVDNRLHVAINTEKDAMEASIFSSVEPAAVGSDVEHEIYAIKNIIDSLDLDRDIYKI